MIIIVSPLLYRPIKFGIQIGISDLTTNLEFSKNGLLKPHRDATHEPSAQSLFSEERRHLAKRRRRKKHTRHQRLFLLSLQMGNINKTIQTGSQICF
jgi:hypothetical protein